VLVSWHISWLGPLRHAVISFIWLGKIISIKCSVTDSVLDSGNGAYVPDVCQPLCVQSFFVLAIMWSFDKI